MKQKPIQVPCSILTPALFLLAVGFLLVIASAVPGASMVGAAIRLLGSPSASITEYELAKTTITIVVFVWFSSTATLITSFGLYRGWPWSYVSAACLFIGTICAAATLWHINAKIVAGLVFMLLLHGLPLVSNGARRHCLHALTSNLLVLFYVGSGSVAFAFALGWVVR